VVIHDFGDLDGRPFIITELVEGETLRQRLKRGALPVGEAVAIATQIASALVAAHARAIVHRDIKPENVMVRPDGYVKVLDFGLAKLVGPTAQATTESHCHGGGILLGTPHYMSPEQAEGKAVDERSDVFSLGVILVRTRDWIASVHRRQLRVGAVVDPERCAHTDHRRESRAAGRSVAHRPALPGKIDIAAISPQQICGNDLAELERSLGAGGLRVATQSRGARRSATSTARPASIHSRSCRSSTPAAIPRPDT
jgi:hypothetical protein